MKKTFLFVSALAVAAAVADSRIYPTDVNVRDFGAKGDGVTDDTAAIQAAADAAAKCAAKMQRGVGGRHCARNSQSDGPMPRLVFPAGKYLVSSPVVFARDHQVYGFDGATVKAAADDIDVFVFRGTMRHFVTGLTMVGGSRQFLVETYNNESANFTARDCTFRNARTTAVDSHSWRIGGGKEGGKLVRIGTYCKNEKTGKWEKDPRRNSPELRSYNNSTLLTLERCRFEDCQVATDVNPDGAVFRELEVVTSVSTSCVFRVANNLHAYSLDVTVRRPKGAKSLAVFEYINSHGLLVEHSRFRSADGGGVALLRNAAQKAAYISNTLILRSLEVACGGCPEGGVIVCPNRKPVEFISMTDVTDTTGRRVKAIAYPDGISLDDYKEFRQFKQIDCDLTYSIVLGRNSRNIDESLPEASERYREPGSLAPESVAPLKVPRRVETGGEVLWGPDYGVRVNSSTNDTAAMKRLFAAASAKPHATVMLPPRRIVLDDTVDVSGSFTVTAPGIAMVEAARDDMSIFRVADGSRVAFAHVFFKGGLHHLACEVDGGATVVLDSCLSFDAEKAAFLMKTRGDPGALRFRIDGGVHYNPVWYEGNANAILAGAWMRILPPKPYGEPYNESCSVVNFGRMRYQDILGVPCVFAGLPKISTEREKAIAPGDYRWIDNRGGELHSLFSRFGGEWGGIPPVYSYDGGKVLIEGSYGYFYPRYTAHQPIITDGVPADLRLFGMSCGFEVQIWYGGLKFMRRTPSGELEPIPDAKVRGNVPRIPVK